MASYKKFFFDTFDYFDIYLFNFRNRKEINCIIKKRPNFFQLMHDKTVAYTIFGINEKEEKIPLIIAWKEQDFYDNTELGMFPSKELEDAFDHELLKQIKIVFKKLTCSDKRVYAYCTEDAVEKRFLEYLSFKQEGIHPKFGMLGETMYSYGYIPS